MGIGLRQGDIAGHAPANRGWVAAQNRTAFDGAALEHGDRLETKGVSNKSELMDDVVAVPKVSAKNSRNVRDLDAYAKKGTDLDRLEVAMNKITDGATINYLARCSTSDVTQMALLRSSKLDAAAVANFARSANIGVRTAARNHPNYKPSAAEWPAHALNRLLHGRRTAA